jgi:hypothetical protein
MLILLYLNLKIEQKAEGTEFSYGAHRPDRKIGKKIGKLYDQRESTFK